jgi:hypothetical protein
MIFKLAYPQVRRGEVAGSRTQDDGASGVASPMLCTGLFPLVSGSRRSLRPPSTVLYRDCDHLGATTRLKAGGGQSDHALVASGLCDTHPAHQAMPLSRSLAAKDGSNPGSVRLAEQSEMRSRVLDGMM